MECRTKGCEQRRSTLVLRMTARDGRRATVGVKLTGCGRHARLSGEDRRMQEFLRLSLLRRGLEVDPSTARWERVSPALA